MEGIMTRLRLFFWLPAALAATAIATFSALSAEALENCKVSVFPSDGTIFVSANGVVGPLLSGPTDADTTHAFSNAVTCVIAQKARQCTLGGPGTPERITPPPLCTLYLRDDGTSATCSVHIKGCTPGVRTVMDVSARVFNSTNIAIANDTSTALTFDTERWDTDGMHSGATPSRLTINTPGKYYIYGHVEWGNPGTGFVVQLSITLNGATILASHREPAIDTARQSVSTHYELSAGDYVELIVLQTSGASLNVQASPNFSPEFGVVKVP